jgi:hypothetical protein
MHVPQITTHLIQSPSLRQRALGFLLEPLLILLLNLDQLLKRGTESHLILCRIDDARELGYPRLDMRLSPLATRHLVPPARMNRFAFLVSQLTPSVKQSREFINWTDAHVH